MRSLRRLLDLLVRSLRFIVGGALIVLGILGVVLPVLPGMPFLILGTLIIGRRSRLLRQLSVAGKRLLRRWAGDRRPIVARIGRWSVAAQQDSSKRLRHITWWLRELPARYRQRRERPRIS